MRAAFVFLTRLPVGGFPYSQREWQWASAWFPLVGMALGTFSAIVWMLALPLGAWVAAISALTLSVLLTGGFHEDGLADTADALGGAFDRERIFVILRDSRVGAFGGLALVISIVFRLTLLARLGSVAPDVVPICLILTHALARTGPVWLMTVLPYVSGPEARSRSLVHRGTGSLIVATLTGFGALAGAAWGTPPGGMGNPLGPASSLAALGALVLATALCGWRFRARAGGLTGDFLGATEQIGEIAILLALAATLTGHAP